MILDYFKLSFGNLKRKKLRSGLTVVGILISIAIIFFLISMSLGLKQAVGEQFKILGSDKFFIMPKGQLGAPGTGGAASLTEEDVKVVEKLPGVKDISYATAGNAKVEFQTKIRYFMIAGIPLDKMRLYTESTNLKLDEGRVLKSGDGGVAMIGYDYKYSNVFNKPVKTGDRLTINGQEFRVVGVLARIGNPQDDKNILIPSEDFKELFNSSDRVDQIVVQVINEKELKQIADLAKEKLMRFRGVKEKTIDFTIMTPEELLASFGIILNIITAFLLGVAGISLVVGGIGIMNTMYTSTLERTKEIGTMKAIGARNSDILSIFVIEAGLLGFVGGAIGVVLGAGLAKAVEYIAITQLNTTLLKAATPFYLFAGCLGFAFFAGVIAGMLTAYQASKLKP
ncbi:MAG: ABC transporter permease, partial [Candidatus Pacearchaeota archaeon]|nr:ABC transporter permease [Candidatus Pacearchaeota archaeon]